VSARSRSVPRRGAPRAVPRRTALEACDAETKNMRGAGGGGVRGKVRARAPEASRAAAPPAPSPAADACCSCLWPTHLQPAPMIKQPQRSPESLLSHEFAAGGGRVRQVRARAPEASRAAAPPAPHPLQAQKDAAHPFASCASCAPRRSRGPRPP
jgi:hypothetical protein